MTIETIFVGSDIHSNIDALTAALSAAESEFGEFDDYISPGDVVGYGPNPHEVIELLREMDFTVVLGNHDEAVATNDYNRVHIHAGNAARINKEMLEQEYPDDLKYLQKLDKRPIIMPDRRLAVVHGSFDNNDGPHNEIYCFDNSYSAFDNSPVAKAVRALDTKFVRGNGLKIGLFGHTHYPFFGVYERSRRSSKIRQIGEPSCDVDAQPKTFDLDDEKIVLCNPGSIGQPRNRNPNTHYMVIKYDGDQVTLYFRNTYYDIGSTQQRMREMNQSKKYTQTFSERIINRLSVGT